MSRKLYVGNLPYETNETDLQELFAQAGAVETVTVMRDRDTGRARGFAFVEMASDDDAQKAITELNDRQFGGRRLTVNEARPQVPRSSPAGNGHARRGFAPRPLTFRARMGVRATISIQEAERARLYDW
jgi:RNA recognition motif-containing protein